MVIIDRLSYLGVRCYMETLDNGRLFKGSFDHNGQHHKITFAATDLGSAG